MNSFDIFGNPVKKNPAQSQFSKAAVPFSVPLTDTEETLVEEEEQQRPIGVLTICIFLSIFGLGLQAVRLQVVEGSENRSLAEGNSVQILPIPADRGLIEDKNGAILAQNTTKTALTISPKLLPVSSSERKEVYAAITKRIPDIEPKILADVEANMNSDYPAATPVVIQSDLTQDQRLLYSEWFASTPGVVIDQVPVRLYSTAPSMAHLLGYVGVANDEEIKAGADRNQFLGKSGLERIYQEVLAGTPGQQRAEINAMSEIVNDSSRKLLDPATGKTLILSIDTKLQEKVAQSLTAEMKRREKKFGKLEGLGAAAVVMDPRNGAIRAMVSLPDYNNNLFANGISSKDYEKLLNNPQNPLLNRAIQGQFQPGSVVKPLIASAALESKLIDPEYAIDTPAALQIGEFRFPDWTDHGVTNIRTAIAESNNIFFYALSGGWEAGNIKGMGIDALNAALKRYGLGSPTQIDLPGELSGLIAGPKYKQEQFNEEWYIGNTYQSSIGQGFTLTTPLQMTAAVGAIANGGTVWRPHVAWSTKDPKSGAEEIMPFVKNGTVGVSKENLKIVREGMRQTVTTGSSRPLNKLKVSSAGKTGTAEFGTAKNTHGWYTGFAPYENPEMVFTILIEGGGDSFYSSVPVAEDILRAYFNEPLKKGEKPFAQTGL